MSLTTHPYYQQPQHHAEMGLAPLDTREPLQLQAPFIARLPEERNQLADYSKLISKHWRTLLVAALAGALLGVFLTLVETPSYRTKTSIEIQNINGDFLNMKQAHPVSDDSQGTDALLDLQTQIEVLQSASLSESTKQALRQDGLKREWMPGLSPFGKWLHLQRTGLTQKVLDEVAKSVRVRVAGQTRIIQIQVDAPNPVLAADFANTLVAEYIHQNIRARTQMTEAAEDWTRGQLVDMRRKLEMSEQALQQYAAKYGLVFTSDRSTISDDGLRQVQSDLLHARTDLAEKQARSQMAYSSKADSLADGEKDTDLRELRSKLVDLRRQEAELLTVYKPTYNEVLKVKAQVTEMEHALAQAQQRVVSRVMDEYKESSEREKLLANAYQSALSKAASDSQTAVQYEILKREADANLSAYQDMLSKVKELSLAAAFRTSNIRVVDPAEAPLQQRTPQLPLNMAFGLLAGLAGAIGFVLISDRNNPSLRHSGEATLRLGIPELATIPSLTSSMADFVALAPPKTGDDFEGGPLTVIEDNTLDDDLETTDAFRTLLASIMFSTHAGEQPKVIVITSVAAQEGKTMVASNLAFALARAGKRVLLVDGDLRNPSLHDKFSVPNMIGLGNLLQAGCDATDAQFAVLPTSITRLSVLPSGSFTAPPADLLFQPNLLALINSYREQFDMIIIDSAPLVGVPDARLLGRAADGVVLVARANKTPRAAIATACHRLGLDHSRVLGIVLNDWNGRRPAYRA